MAPNRSTEAARHARRRRNRMIAAAFFIFVALIIMLESPITRVRKFVVHGNRSIPAQKILHEAKLIKGMSLWQFNQRHVNQLVKAAEPLVQSVRLHTDYLHGIVEIDIALKHVVAVLDASGKFYMLLNDGDVFGQPTGSQGFSYPIITSASASKATNGQPTADPNIALLCAQLDKLPANQLSQISELHLDPYGTVTVYLNNQFEIRCKTNGFTSQLDTGFIAVQYFVSKQAVPGLIDVTGQPPYQYTPLVGGKA